MLTPDPHMYLYPMATINDFGSAHIHPFQGNFASISDTTLQTHIGQGTHTTTYGLLPAVLPALVSGSDSGDGSTNFEFYGSPGMAGQRSSISEAIWAILRDLPDPRPFHFPEILGPLNSLNPPFAHVTHPNPPNNNTMTSSSGGIGPESKKKTKMHECFVCHRLFPRPSGLATHRNSHTGAKPFPCLFPKCNKSFTVRSNANRHLRTHGILPVRRIRGTPTPCVVVFDPPLVSYIDHQPVNLPKKLKWIAPSSPPLIMPSGTSAGQPATKFL